MSKIKYAQHDASFYSAISDAYTELAELRDEVREVVDNAPEGLSETQRIQTLGETADRLDEFVDSEPDYT